VFNESIEKPVIIMVEPEVSANVKEIGEGSQVEVFVKAFELRREVASGGKVEGGVNSNAAFALEQMLRQRVHTMMGRERGRERAKLLDIN
jgi:hypothetical protein